MKPLASNLKCHLPPRSSGPRPRPNLPEVVYQEGVLSALGKLDYGVGCWSIEYRLESDDPVMITNWMVRDIGAPAWELAVKQLREVYEHRRDDRIVIREIVRFDQPVTLEQALGCEEKKERT